MGLLKGSSMDKHVKEILRLISDDKFETFNNYLDENKIKCLSNTSLYNDVANTIFHYKLFEMDIYFFLKYIKILGKDNPGLINNLLESNLISFDSKGDMGIN